MPEFKSYLTFSGSPAIARGCPFDFQKNNIHHQLKNQLHYGKDFSK